MSKILLINPSYAGTYGTAKAALTNPIYPTLGITTVAAEALRRGHQVRALGSAKTPDSETHHRGEPEVRRPYKPVGLDLR